MATPGPEYTAPPRQDQVTGWVGWVWFAGIMLVTIGLFDILQGLIAVFEDTFSVALDQGILIVDATAWGWVHIGVGVLLVVAGAGVLTGATWGRILGVLVAVLNLLAQLSVLTVYPWWAMIVIILDVIVIYALVVHGREAASV